MSVLDINTVYTPPYSCGIWHNDEALTKIKQFYDDHDDYNHDDDDDNT